MERNLKLIAFSSVLLFAVIYLIACSASPANNTSSSSSGNSSTSSGTASSGGNTSSVASTANSSAGAVLTMIDPAADGFYDYYIYTNSSFVKAYNNYLIIQSVSNFISLGGTEMSPHYSTFTTVGICTNGKLGMALIIMANYYITNFSYDYTLLNGQGPGGSNLIAAVLNTNSNYTLGSVTTLAGAVASNCVLLLKK